MRAKPEPTAALRAMLAADEARGIDPLAPSTVQVAGPAVEPPPPFRPEPPELSEWREDYRAPVVI